MNEEPSTGGKPGQANLSVVICVEERADEPRRLLSIYREALAPLGRAVEFVYVVNVDSPYREAIGTLSAPDVRVIELPRQFGDASRLREGARAAHADDVLLLPPYLQVAPDALPDIVRGLEHADLVAAARERRQDALLNRTRGALFRNLARASGSNVTDLGCRVRAVRREVLESVTLQEDQVNFLPIFAEYVGHKVVQMIVPQAEDDRRYRSHSMRAYGDSLLDAVSVGFLVRFLQKPFRLFGAIGLALIIAGVLIGLYLVAQRFEGITLGNRPSLLLSVLLIVLGLQVAAVGLIAEVVLFTRLPPTATYRIRRIIERSAEELPVEQDA